VASESAAALPPPPPRPRHTLDEAIATVTEEELRAHVTTLASDELAGRNPGYPGHEKAAAYLETQLRAAGTTPAGDTAGVVRGFGQRFPIEGHSARNLLGVRTGDDPAKAGQILVIGAHYDHLGQASERHSRRAAATGDDTIWNGADDDASGVAVVLAVARVFADSNVPCARTLLFALFSGEEEGLYGSQYYVRHPLASLASHRLMINLDMVGRNPTIALSLMTSGLGRGALPGLLAESARQAGLRVGIFDLGGRVSDNSDHYPFHAAGVPFVFFWSGDHADYHRPSDHADKLAYGRMVKVAATVARFTRAACDR
jgi:Zn-dependent M28 family amino/carboxypeptidase